MLQFITQTHSLKVYHNLSEYQPTRGAVVTVGTFDGVHVGHRTLLKRICELAATHDLTTILLTFHPHPRLVLFPEDNDLKLLNSLDEKVELLRSSGIEHLVIHPFTTEFSRTTAEQYVADILRQRLNVRKLVIGYDHHFGRNREGNLANLQRLAPLQGFEIEEIPAQEIDHVNVSSTKVRRAILDGLVEKAAAYLGYDYALAGKVVRGDSLGRSMGFPTANLEPDDPLKLVPGRGVYAVHVHLGDQVFQGMANIGTRPTVSPSLRKPTIEVHIFGFNGDLYGQMITVTFAGRLRDEIKFESIELLKIQLEKDAMAARRWFAGMVRNFNGL